MTETLKPYPIPPECEVLDVQRGNDDLVGTGTWTGTPDTADGHAAPLPGDIE